MGERRERIADRVFKCAHCREVVTQWRPNGDSTRTIVVYCGPCDKLERTRLENGDKRQTPHEGESYALVDADLRRRLAIFGGVRP